MVDRVVRVSLFGDATSLINAANASGPRSMAWRTSTWVASASGMRDAGGADLMRLNPDLLTGGTQANKKCQIIRKCTEQDAARFRQNFGCAPGDGSVDAGRGCAALAWRRTGVSQTVIRTGGVRGRNPR